MAKHKAATQVQIIGQEKSEFAQWVDRHWVKGAFLAVVATVGILWYQYSSRQQVAQQDAYWSELASVMAVDPRAGLLTGTSAQLDETLTTIAGTPAEPWARVALIKALVEERRYDDARASLEMLRKANLPALTSTTYALGEGGSQLTLLDRLEQLISRQEAWESDRQGLFSNPPLPEGSPKVRIETTAGPFVVGLYEEEAPTHVENFLKHVDSGFFEGTKFHRVLRGFMIQGGDPNSKEGDVATWGQGGPGYKLDREENKLYHFKGVLSAAKQQGDPQSSGSQFFVTTGTPHWLDGQHVVFGVLLEGEDVVDAIEEGEIVEGTDRPIEPVAVLKTVRL